MQERLLEGSETGISLVLWLVPILACAVVSPASARPEGTVQLGLTQSLGTGTTVWVNISQPGETIRVCTSDDGLQDGDTDDGPVDQAPGAQNPVAPARQGAEIFAFPAGTPPCRRSADCPPDSVCVDRQREQVTDSFAEDEIGLNNRCAMALSVTPQRGYCTANLPAQTPHTLDTDQIGVWSFDFAGEPETLTDGGRTTRYFEIEILDPDGRPVEGGRVWSDQWLLRSHGAAGASNAEFYAKVPVGGGADIFVLTFNDFAVPRYTVLANPEGVHEVANRSACVYAPVSDDPLCASLGLRARNAYADFPIFLNFPDLAEGTRPAPRLNDARFEDEVGTPTLSPNGDGVQDEGVFSFFTNVDGRYAVVIDADLVGLFGSAADVILTGAARPGLNEVIWNGRDHAGAPLPEGSYRVQIQVRIAETHFPFARVGNNPGGFSIAHQTSPNPEDRVTVPMYWDDTGVRTREHLLLGDLLSTLPRGTNPEGAPVYRRWRQPGWPDENRPVIFDTWVNAGVLTLDEINCHRCRTPRNEVVIGRDEAGDRDDDGLSDEVEDADGDGIVDANETDPDDPDTDGDGLDHGLGARTGTNPITADSDGDGLDDGREDRNRDGNLDRGETDPRSADSDGDGLSDGAEDSDGDGRVNPGETDPLRPDTDGDGLTDGLDPHPTIPETDVDAGAVDAGVMDGGSPDSTMPIGGQNVPKDFDTSGGCDGCDIGPQSEVPWELMLLLLGGIRRSRRRLNSRLLQAPTGNDLSP